MEKTYFNVSTTFIAALLLTAMGVIMVYALNTQESILGAERDRRHALMLGDELFQSSEDLTRMARSYVVTGDPAYERYYFDILNIRDGKRPRPREYHGTYWHLSGIGKAPAIAAGEAVPLQALMRNAGITAQELALLTEALNRSDGLVRLEREAFAAVRGVFSDSDGALAIRRAPDRKYAIDLLYGDRYVDLKARIMEPISRFISLIDQRTDTVLADRQNRLEHQIKALLALVAISLAGVFYIGLQILFKVIQPLKHMAYFDALTGLVNRTYFQTLVHQEMVRSTRYDRPLSMLMIDIDRFKRINDTYGHAIGDKALQKLSHVFREVMRETDIPCRYGGEEFVIILPETDEKHALEAAERLRVAIAESSLPLKGKEPLRFTVSIGVTTVRLPPGSIDEMIDRADSALYAAKNMGRNRVCFEKAVEELPVVRKRALLRRLMS